MEVRLPHKPKEYAAPRAPSIVSLAALTLVSCAALGGFVLRVEDLALQSLWFDEAMSVVFAVKPPTELLALLITEDIHPPLYPLLLHFWTSVAGSGEFSARFLSVFAGVALVPLFYVTGKRLALLAGNEAPRFSLVGLIGTLLAASSAFYVGYSQETRNYMLVTFLGLLSSYLLLRAMPSARGRPWGLYAAATCAAVYTNYTAFLLVVFQGIFVLLSRATDARLMRRWMLSIVAVVAAYLPWMGFAFDQVIRINDYWPGTLRVGEAVRSTFVELVAGGGADVPAVGPQVLLVVGLLAVGMLALAVGASRARHKRHSLFLLLYFAVPTAVLFAIAYTRPKFDPRYLLVATPAFYLILAWGMAALLEAARSRMNFALRIALPCLGALALLAVVAASTVYGEPTKVKADYRSLVSFVESKAEPGDAVVVLMNAPHPYTYYETKGVPWYPMERVDDFQGAITRLNKLADGHRRLWFILWQNEWEDPAGYVMHVMEDQATEVKLGETFTGLNLRLFVLSPNHDFSYYPPMQMRVEATFGNVLEFWGWKTNRTTLEKEQFSTSATSGEKVQVDLHWIPQKRLPKDYKLSLSLVDADRHGWAHVDEVMGTPLFPPAKWQEGEIIHDVHSLQIPSGTPPGDYSVELSLYDPVTLRPLDITTAGGSGIGAVLTLGQVHVYAPARVAATTTRLPLFAWQLNGIPFELQDMRLNEDVAAPGDRVEVMVQWRVPQQVAGDYSARLVLLDSKAGHVVEQTISLSAGYPTSRWRAGEVVIGRYWLPLPVDLSQERYWVAVAPLAPGAQSVPAAMLAQFAYVDVVIPEAKYEIPAMQHPVGARLGAMGELAGYDLSGTQAKPGGKITLTLYWRDLTRFDRSYKVFTHVIDDKNVFAGQRDAVPVNDTRPTTTWRKGEVITDRYEIPVSPDAKPGSYKLKVGMYSEENMQRLQIVGGGGPPSSDSITLATIEVVP